MTRRRAVKRKWRLRPVRFRRGTDAASTVLPDTPDVRALLALQLWAQEYRREKERPHD